MKYHVKISFPGVSRHVLMVTLAHQGCFFSHFALFGKIRLDYGTQQGSGLEKLLFLVSSPPNA